MSTVKTNAVTGVTTNSDLTLSGNGTGGVTVSDYFILSKGNDIASATALVLGTDGNAFDVTGTTTITSIGTQGIGSNITLHFDGALTFTHHSTDLILPGAANITTATGDVAVMYEYASGDWRCVSYTKASGIAVVAPATASTTVSGLSELATTAETTTGTDTGRAITPAGMHGALAALTDATITASDTIIFADVGSSNALKEDTVQGILDLVSTGASAAEAANIMLNAFRISVNGGLTKQNMVDGVVDEFENETGVDTSTSTNENYDATDDFYANQDNGAMTTSSANWAGDTADFTFSGDDIQCTNSAGQSINTAGSTPIVLSGDFEFTVDLVAEPNSWGLGVYPVSDDSSFSAGPSVNGGMASMTASWFADGEQIRYGSASRGSHTTWGNPSEFKIKRVSNVITIYEDDVVAWTFAETSSADMRFVHGSNNTSTNFDNFVVVSGGTRTTLNMGLFSNASTALAAPDDANIVIWQQDVDSVTLNTDLKAYASRNGGTTYTQMTLAEVANLTTGRVLTGAVDISGQSSATAMKYKIETLNTKHQKIHAVALQWS